MNWTLSAFSDEAGSSSDQQIGALLRAGLRRMDIRHIDGHNISELPIEQAKIVKAKLDEHGILAQMFGSPIGKTQVDGDPIEEMNRLNHLGELAPIFGCGAVRVFSFYNRSELAHDEWKKRALERLAALRDRAEKVGLVLYHENERHIFGDLAADVETLATLRNASFKLIFDFDNYQQGGQDVWATWQGLADRTDAIHLKDSTQENKHVPVGEGNGQVEKILSDALARGWSGPLTLEPHLTHSQAVLATGPGGQRNRAFAGMKPDESFHIAAQAAVALLDKVGAPWN